MNKHNKYLDVCNKLRKRYSKDGKVVISVGGKLSNYTIFEDMAAIKYLGCNPAKLNRGK